MTPEQRLDRLERIAKLMVKAGLRARKQAREQSEKINMLIDAQLRSEDRLDRLAEAQARTEERLAEAQVRTEERLAEAQALREEREARLDARLDRLVETVERYISERRGGNP